MNFICRFCKRYYGCKLVSKTNPNARRHMKECKRENFKKYGIDMSNKTLIIETPMECTPRIFPMVAVNTAKVKSILELTKNEKLKVEFI